MSNINLTCTEVINLTGSGNTLEVNHQTNMARVTFRNGTAIELEKENIKRFTALRDGRAEVATKDGQLITYTNDALFIKKNNEYDTTEIHTEYLSRNINDSKQKVNVNGLGIVEIS